MLQRSIKVSKNRKTRPNGAFTWGVLDALIERGVTVEAISGASAGAFNAVFLAHGWLEGGDDLRAFGQASKLNAQRGFLQELHGLGRAPAEGWLDSRIDTAE